MVATVPAIQEVWSWLEEVADPEIPVISVVDLGIVRGVRVEGDEIVVSITPTYSGCPAMEVIAGDIRKALEDRGIGKVRLETRLSPPWTTDWLSAKGREQLRAYGIAPPGTDLIQIRTHPEKFACPHCGSAATEMVSRYGSTPCKAIYRCRECQEPFDAFKRH